MLGPIPMEHPHLRAIEAVQLSVGSRPASYVRDPTHLTAETVFVLHRALLMPAHDLGSHSTLNIHEVYASLVFQ